MNIGRITIGIIGLLATGCNGNNDTNSSPLLGVWVTESCEQASDSNGMFVNFWLKGLYEFTEHGTLLKGYEEYTDSSCEIPHDTVEPHEDTIPITYTDQGQVVLQEGINGGELVIEMGEGTGLVSVDGFYTINSGSLCFSDAFTFEATEFGITQSGADAIDFDHCLTKLLIP
jgi:hypothetical protein